MSDTARPSGNYALPRYHEQRPGDPLTLRDVYEIIRYGVKALAPGETVRAGGCRWTLVEPEEDPRADDYEEVFVRGQLLLLDRRVWKQMVATLEKHLEKRDD